MAQRCELSAVDEPGAAQTVGATSQRRLPMRSIPLKKTKSLILLCYHPANRTGQAGGLDQDLRFSGIPALPAYTEKQSRFRRLLIIWLLFEHGNQSAPNHSKIKVLGKPNTITSTYQKPPI